MNPREMFQEDKKVYLAEIESELRQLKEPRLTGDTDFDEMLRDCIETLETKGAEYTIGSKDRLANFKKVAETVDSSMEKVWFTYFYKHYSAVASYVKNGCRVKSNEPISGRIMDCVVYLLIFHKMTKEIEAGREMKKELK